MSRMEMVVFLLYVSAVQGQKSEKVSCTPTNICAVIGSTVEINCIFPATHYYGVPEISWYKTKNDQRVDLTTEANYAGRIKYSCEQQRCSLSIWNLKWTDAAKYNFHLKYHQGTTYSNEVTLSVTELTTNKYSTWGAKCSSSCKPPHPSYIWYGNGRKISQTQSYVTVSHSGANSYSCALTGSEDFHSPSICVVGESCNRVIYTDRRICALEGSSVEISCTYNSYNKDYIWPKFWFSPKRNRYPVDLRQDSQYSGRVQVVEPETGHSTLRITNLNKTDSAQYRFKFKTGRFEWGSDLPGTTLTVTDVWVEVFRYFSPPKLKCETRCHLRDGSSYVWFKNGKKIPEQSSYFYSVSWDSWDSFSCAVKGFEEFTSHAVCASGAPCNKVIYNDRRVCAFKGSSVDINCSYSGYYYIQTHPKFWFRPDSHPQWHNPSEPEDLSADPQYSGRVKFLEPQTGRSTLRITNLTESDSAEYRFKFKVWGSDLPGTNLMVTAVQLQVSRGIGVHPFETEGELRCVSSCSPTGLFDFVWFKNRQEVQGKSSSSYTFNFHLEDDISCALRGYEDYRSASVYAPKLPSVSVNASAEIVEGSSVNLTCSSDANPAADYTWYKKDLIYISDGPQLVLPSIHSFQSGEYYCVAQNKLGRRSSSHHVINVKYPPKSSTLLRTPSAEIVEGSSVTLTCSSDANPAANYTWYKGNQTLLQGPEGVYRFSSISSEDRGTYHCKSENQYGEINSTSLFLDVMYAPKLPSVSVSPSAEIVEGSSVNLTCSSDANPAADYTWYKEDEDSPKASGQIFTITDLRPEHSGNYYCEAQNARGRHNSTLNLTIFSSSSKSAAAGSITVLLLAFIVLIVVLLIRRRRSLKPPSEVGVAPNIITEIYESPDYENSSGAVQIKAADNILYASVRFAKNPEALYSNIRTTQPNTEEKMEDEDGEKDEDEGVEYSTINVKRVSASPRIGLQEGAEDPCALYSTVSKKYRV